MSENPRFAQSVLDKMSSQPDQTKLGTEVYRFGKFEGKKRGQRFAPARVGIVFGQISHALGRINM